MKTIKVRNEMKKIQRLLLAYDISVNSTIKERLASEVSARLVFLVRLFREELKNG